MTKSNCYQCKHRRDLAGDCHSRCAHPRALSGADGLGIVGTRHGIERGWFFWPFNFDPVWLEACDGFESKEEAPCQKS